MRIALFSNQQKIQRHFYRAHACFVKYFLMTKKLQQTKKLAYVTTCDWIERYCTVLYSVLLPKLGESENRQILACMGADWDVCMVAG